MWNIAIQPAVGCYNSWANLRCSGCVPLGVKLLWNRSITSVLYIYIACGMKLLIRSRTLTVLSWKFRNGQVILSHAILVKGTPVVANRSNLSFIMFTLNTSIVLTLNEVYLQRAASVVCGVMRPTFVPSVTTGIIWMTPHRNVCKMVSTGESHYHCAQPMRDGVTL